MKNLKNLSPSDYLKILLRRKWYAVAVFVLTIGGCAIYTLRQPYIYKSTAMLQVEAAPISRDYVRSAERSTPQEWIAAVREKIQSRTFMEQLVQEFGIGEYGDDRDFVMENAILAIRNNIEVKSSSSNTFTISYSSADARQAQDLTRRLVDLLRQSSNIARKTKAVETDQFIDEQLRDTDQKLKEQEDKIEEFKSAHFGQLPDQMGENVRTLNDLKTRLEMVDASLQSARNRKKLIKLRSQQNEDLFSGDFFSSDSIPGDADIDNGTSELDALLSQKQKELDALSLRYKPSYPDVIRATREIEDIKERIEKKSAEAEQEKETPAEDTPAGDTPTLGPDNDLFASLETGGMDVEAEMLDEEIKKIEQNRQAILDEMRVYEDRMKRAPALEKELTALDRVRDSLARDYLNLRDKKFQAQMAANLETDRGSDTYKTIDEANFPETPFSPNRRRIAVVGLGLAFALGIGAAFGRELLDTTLSTEEEASMMLNVPVLVSVYEISTKKARKSEKEQLSKSA